jgi:protoheme IX farnesyltransferase
MSLLETTKPGITRLVTITAGVGFAMGHFTAGPTAAPAFETAVSALACLVGTYLTAGGANALNQLIERMRDGRMNRTSRRPLPQDRVTPGAVFAFGMLSTVVGVAVLLVLGGGWPPAATALACTLVYTLAYTPMKTRSAWSTYVGTIPGALPPVIGWVAAWPGDPVSRFEHWGAWSLFALMTVWQLPHSFALAWMYKDDYAKGGFRLLPVIDASGRKTSRTIAGWALLQIPATLGPVLAMPGVLGWPYAALAVASGLGYLHLSVRLLKTRAVADARKVFFVSIAHLPLLLVAMVVEGALRRYL